MSIDLGSALLVHARFAIAERLGIKAPQPPDHPALEKVGATFVTLTQGGELRGCIGSLEAFRPLWEDVRENALGAAFRDPRFPHLSADEYGRTRVEVSLLATPQPLSFTDEADALRQLQPGRDGLILTHPGGRATFLPQVWAGLPEPTQFLAQLKSKAGLPKDYWSGNIALARYRVKKWKESEPTPA